MNYYPHHIGDYMTATAHLTWLEDCAYRRILDTYYVKEHPLPADVGQVCRLVRAQSKDERKAVETVLKEFFQLIESGWAHGRCDREIAKARVSAERAKTNGKKGGRPPKEKPDPNPEKTQWVSAGLVKETQTEPNPKAPNPKPNTNTSEDKSSDGKPSARDAVFANGVPLLTIAGVAEKNARSMLAMLCKTHGDDAVADAIAECAKHRPVEPVSWLQATLKPVKQAKPESFRERDERAARERVAAFAPGVAARGPSTTTPFTIESEARHVAAIEGH